MTTFPLLILLMVTATIAWLTRPLWQQRSAPGRHGGATHVPAGLPLPRAKWLAGGVGLFVMLVAAVGYSVVGAPQHADLGPSSQAAIGAAGVKEAPAPKPATLLSGAGDDPLAQAESRVSAMVDSLAERLKARPGDAEGWQLLGRSYAALGRHAQAVAAFRTAATLHPNDPTLLAEQAFSVAVLEPQNVDGEPARLIEKALALDPRNPKALALAGTLALDRKDYQGAVLYWEQLARVEPAGSPVAKQVQTSIRQARQLGGMPAAGGVVEVGMAAGASMSAGTVSASAAAAVVDAPRAQVSGTVSLAPALRSKASPDDTVFIYARPAIGPRMPLAVLRKQVKDLPLRFTLDDSLAMSPAARLSSATRVVVGARIARGGNAVARDGDLQGQLAALPVGTSDLRVEINEVVRTR
jgi:cytochrome c-type biogenesis protein CcmH